jgi:hypothetical protein
LVYEFTASFSQWSNRRNYLIYMSMDSKEFRNYVKQTEVKYLYED